VHQHGVPGGPFDQCAELDHPAAHGHLADTVLRVAITAAAAVSEECSP